MSLLLFMPSWNLHFRQNINDWEMEEVTGLLKMLEEFPLGDWNGVRT